MNNVSILDCTLRDGSYPYNKRLGQDTIRRILFDLVHSGIEYIEIGFLENESKGKDYPIYVSPKDADDLLVNYHTFNTNFLLLADYSRYNPENLTHSNDSIVKFVRITFFKHELSNIHDYILKFLDKGYLCFIQPVDTLSYDEKELETLISIANETNSYCLSIVDTYGSMYHDDLKKVFDFYNSRMMPNIRIGFHSHNNLQLSFSLSISFHSFARQHIRNIIVDTTLNGMGRGAGNTPTELVVEYLEQKFNHSYDLSRLLVLIQDVILKFKHKNDWAYSVPMFLAGKHSAHVNNIDLLLNHNLSDVEEIASILSILGEQKKNYDLTNILDKFKQVYLSKFDDKNDFLSLKSFLDDQDILLLLPGKTIVTENQLVDDFIETYNPVVIGVNYASMPYKLNFLFFSNLKMARRHLSQTNHSVDSIYTSNLFKPLSNIESGKRYFIDLNRVNYFGMILNTNSLMNILQILDLFELKSINIAGLDGYNESSQEYNYFSDDLELFLTANKSSSLNEDIQSNIDQYLMHRKSHYVINTITTSRFSFAYKEDDNETK